MKPACVAPAASTVLDDPQTGVDNSMRERKRVTSDPERTPGEAVRGSNHAERLRVRAAWMYYVEQLTQSEIAAILDVGRVTVVRLLADARARNEVNISINAKVASTIDLERGLEEAFGIGKAIVAPLSAPGADPVPVISAAAGAYISQIATSNMRVGVGWGRTLYSTLPFIRGHSLTGFKVFSLLGGIIQARRFNPAEYAWQLAELFQGEGFLVPAPAIVDSIETKRALIERCGLNTILETAENLDAVLLSVGGHTTSATSYRVGYLTDEQHDSLIAAGAVGDLLFHFFDRNGELIDHEINDRIMSVGIDRLRQAPIRLLASGGADKVTALAGAMKLVEPTVLITDEVTAAGMISIAAERASPEKKASKTLKLAS
jgi:deoxyribonucleoside regulator